MNEPDQRIDAVPAAASTVPVPRLNTTRLRDNELVEPADTAAPFGSWHFVAHDGSPNTPAASGFSTVTFPSRVA
ncbi:hypothetical protein [Actinacidiphila glaucinigra]|uniref:hypothetical protein n=1 Tax=Actinacidiphila glaucinigra TaxID=235986 RepID=UPI000B78C8D6|nr:hypothetical protein [Actinacidiphila glaucinigra]